MSKPLLEYPVNVIEVEVIQTIKVSFSNSDGKYFGYYDMDGNVLASSRETP